MTRLTDYLETKRALVEGHLAATLRPEPGFPASLLEAMRYSLLAPGKRLRPLLVVMAAEACGGRECEPWPGACSVEMIHAYSLIHDDLPAMDDDDLRRGQPTCHKKFGEALAILAGDALQTLAFQVLAEGYLAVTAAACCRVLARASGMSGMVGGQVDDIAWESATDSNVERNVHLLENLHGRKTGALIRAALQIGVHAGHAGKSEPAGELLGRFDAYGQHLGLLFQITDDLLDVEGHSDQTGKRVQKDAARGKLTYPQLLGVAGSRDRAKQLCEEARSLMRPLGDSAAHLAALANYVLERDR